MKIIRLLRAGATAAAMLSGIVTPSAAADASSIVHVVTAEDLLPDLQVEPLSDFRVQILDGRRIVRFTTTIANRGDGALEVAGTRTSTSTSDLSVVQHIYQPDGSYVPVPVPALLHYSENDRYRWNLADAVEYALKVPGEATPRVTHNVGLCLTDETRLAGTTDARSYDCLAGRPDSRSVTEGTSAGWSHTYRYYMQDQWVDLSGLPLPGQYCITATADPQKMLTEKSQGNNAASELVDLSSNGAVTVSASC